MQLTWLDAERDAPELTLDHLRQSGVLYERVTGDLDGDRDQLQPLLDRLKASRGYVEQDIVELGPDTPKLDELCAKVADEHLHEDDEVRFVLAGEGIFDIRDTSDRWMRVTVEAGDLIVVPHHRYHRFFLGERQQIRCVRLFKDSSGWVPHYR